MNTPGPVRQPEYTDRQNRLILEGTLSNSVLAERFGKSVRQIQRQRALLKEAAK